jgi:hypothetical protein
MIMEKKMLNDIHRWKPRMKNLIYPIILCNALAGTVCAGQNKTQSAQDTIDMPDQALLDAWYAKFEPGQYEVTNYEIDPRTEQRIEGSASTISKCIDTFTITSLSSMPAMSFLDRSCKLLKIDFNGSRFFSRGYCIDDQQNVIHKQVSVSLSEDNKQIDIRGFTAQQSKERGDDPKMLSSNGSIMVRQGACEDKVNKE